MSFTRKIDMILEAKKLERLSINKIEKQLGVDGTIYKAHKADKYPVDSELVRKLIGILGIRQEWWDKEWESGSTDIFITPVQNQAAVAGNAMTAKDLLVVLQDVLAERSDYRIIPKTVLDGEYRLLPLSEIEHRAKELESRTKELEDIREERKQTLEAKNKLIKRLEDEIAELRGMRNPITPQGA